MSQRRSADGCRPPPSIERAGLVLNARQRGTNSEQRATNADPPSDKAPRRHRGGTRGHTFGSNTPEAYERLILDALNGDGTLFIRGDEAETSWGLISPVLEYWANQGRRGLESYAAGTWGPLAADKLLLKSGHEWITGKEYGQ